MNEKPKEPSKIRFLHLVDHDGTIFKLVSLLSVYPDHKVLTSFSYPLKKTMQNIDKISKNKKAILILHATGNNKKVFYKMKEDIIKKFKKAYVFLHVSPTHFLIKNRRNELDNLKKLVEKYNVGILVYSNEVKKEFSYYGLNAIPIQVGINFGSRKYYNDESIRNQKKYLTTVCTSEEGVYHYIKGIDIFYKLIKDMGIEKDGLILGNNSNLFKGVKTKKVSQTNFLKYLKKSKVYIQLSRTEAYNLSAIYAKRLKIPIIVTDIEGHKDNVKYGFRINSLKDAKKCLKNILSNYRKSKIKKIVDKNYRDSLKRETLNNFRNSFNKLLSS